MSNRRSLWTMVLPLALTLGASSAWAQDEDPPAAAPGAAPDVMPVESTPGEAAANAEVSAGAEGSVEVGATGSGDMQAMPMVGPMPGVYTKDNWPLELVKRPIVLAKGMIEVKADLLVNLSKDLVGKPFSVSPDILFGVNDKLTVGLTHQTGLCLAGEDNGCAKVYDDAAIEAIYAFLTGELDVGAHVALEFVGFDPMTVGIDVGVTGRFRSGQIGVSFDPQLYIGLTERDAGNKEQIGIPVQIAYQVSPRLAPFAIVGLFGALEDFGNNFQVPVGFGALYSISNKLDVGGQLVFPNLAGKNNTADLRVLDLFLNFRL